MQRKVAYVFHYRNGIRENSVGVIRCNEKAGQPEVTLELFGKSEQGQRWHIYYFHSEDSLAEATYVWERATGRGRSEVPMHQCRLCAEAGRGSGVLLLPETVAKQWTGKRGIPDTGEYLGARFDGTEITEGLLQKAYLCTPEIHPEGKVCVESAKRLMEEITKAAGGAVEENSQKPERQEELSLSERRAKSRRIACLEELFRKNPSYSPCRENGVGYSVRISPSDLQLFPKEGTSFTENSFLLHGYYRYRHVLLGRRKGKNREEYVVLVPGNYEEKEGKLAKVFGFSEFLPIIPETANAVPGKKRFGYWCGKI